MLALQLLAAAEDTIDYTADATSSAAAGGVLAAFMGFGILFWIVAMVFGIFTIWMFIDALMRSDADYEKVGSGTKVMWALLIFFLGAIPAIVYWFMVRKKAKAGTTPAAPAAK
jgi:hypothetical protein